MAVQQIVTAQEHIAAARNDLATAIKELLTSGSNSHARQLFDVLESLSTAEELLATFGDDSPPSFQVRRVGASNFTAADTSQTGTRPSTAERRYPYFSVSDGALIKTGRSRFNESSEYRQVVPRQTFEELVHWIVRQPLSNSWMSRDMEVALKARGVPSYAAYAALGALTTLGLITKLARGEYRVTPKGRLVPFNEWWGYLTEQLGAAASEGGEAADNR